MQQQISTGSKEPQKALVTLALGRQGAEWLAMSGPFFEAYARRTGCTYIAITERRIRHRLQWRKPRVNLHLEKFQIGPMLEQYERILYADADLIISPRCPDLFAMVPEECLGVVADPAGEQMWKRDEEMAAMEKRFSALPQPLQPYFNAGLLVLSRAHRELLSFDPSRLLPGRWPDQTALNYHSAAARLPRTYMDPRANFLPGHEGWESAGARSEAWAVHYAGPEAKPLMRQDCETMQA